MTITETTVRDSLKRYFKTLMSTGYSKPCDSRRLLICLMILDILSDKMNMFLTPSAKGLLERIYRRIMGDCLIPYTKYCTDKAELGSYTVGTETARENSPSYHQFRILKALDLIATTEEE